MLERGSRRELEGVVVSQKMHKTIVVNVRRRVLHPRYKKYVVKSKKYYAHDEKQEASLGDIVRIRESQPLSKLKKWRFTEVVRRVTQ